MRLRWIATYLVAAALGVALGLLLPVPGHPSEYYGVIKDCTPTAASGEKPGFSGCQLACVARRPSLVDCLVALDAVNNSRRGPGFLGLETATCTRQPGELAVECLNLE